MSCRVPFPLSGSFPLRLLCTTVLLLIGWGSARSQVVVTTVTTIDGLVFRGTIIARELDSLKMITLDSQRVSLAYWQVATIREEGKKPREDPYARPPAPKETAIGDHPFFGATLCTPLFDKGWINLLAGFRMGRFGARLTCIYHNKGNEGIGGAQFDLLFNVQEDEYTSADVCIGIGLGPDIVYNGRFIDEEGSFIRWGGRRRYTAIGFDINLVGFYANGTLTFGPSDQANPQFLFQIGWVVEVGRATIFD